MSSDESSLAGLTGSAYTAALSRGVSQLRFADPLESHYIEAHLNRVRLRVRLWLSLGALVSLIYSVIQARRTGIVSAGFAMEFLVVFPSALLLAWLTWTDSGYRRFYMRLAPALITAKGAIAAYFIAQLVGRGHDEEIGILAIYVVAAFFFSGLLFRSALVAAAAILASWTVTMIFIGPLSFLAVKCLVLFGVTAVMGAIVYRDVERSYRRGFLESAIIQELVARDALTGLMNRRALDEQLTRVWLQAQRDRRSLAFLMIDIDRFKSYNDAYGHQAGDAVLRSVAHLLQEFTRRPFDIGARYGGDEFAVILYDMPPADVRDIAARICQAVQRAAVSGEAEPKLPGVTISIGAGIVTPALGRTLHGALQFADEALYQAKEAGRNCIVVRGEEDYPELKTGTFRALSAAAR